MTSAAKALLLDSGGVLMRPVDGRWHPRADFEATVKAHAPHVTDADLAEAVREGDRSGWRGVDGRACGAN